MVGEPTGVNFKAWTSVKTAFVGGAAWSFAENGSFAFHLDYIFHQYDWISVEKGRLPVVDLLCAACLHHRRVTGRARVVDFLNSQPIETHRAQCPALKETP